MFFFISAKIAFQEIFLSNTVLKTTHEFFTLQKIIKQNRVQNRMLFQSVLWHMNSIQN